jgi:hypothetical protein
MTKSIALMLAMIVGGHGLIGLFIEGEHMLGIFTVDIALDLVYLGSAALLLAAALLPVSALTIRILVAIPGLSFLVLGLSGMADPHLGGAAPTGLTLMDEVVFFAQAGACAVAILLKNPHLTLWQDDATGRGMVHSQ